MTAVVDNLDRLIKTADALNHTAKISTEWVIKP